MDPCPYQTAPRGDGLNADTAYRRLLYDGDRLGGVAWIIVALGAFILLMVLGMALAGPRMTTIERAVALEVGPVSPTLHHALRDPLLWISIQTRVAIALGIVFLMTVKPDLSGSLLTIGVAIILGLASSLPISGRARTQDEATL